MQPSSLRDYFGQIELAIKQRVGVVPEQVLYELHEEMAATITKGQGLNAVPEEVSLPIAYGDPAEIAAAHGDDDQPPDRGTALGWRICCTVCGRSSPAGCVGITRIAARSWHKYTAGKCKTCDRVTPCRLLRDLDRVTLTDAILEGKTPEQIRKRKHHPWMTVVAILILVGLIQWLVWWFFFPG